jgi:hypothetical protein
MADDIIAGVRAYLAEHDPDVLAAVDDVDRSLIRSELQRSPLTRLVASAQQARFYERLAASRTAPKVGAKDLADPPSVPTGSPPQPDAE